MAQSALARVHAARLSVDLDTPRHLGIAMLALGTALPYLPHNPGVACPLRTLTGVPCPLCGMTTSVKAVCSGRLATALAANPMGLVAVAVAVALILRPDWRTWRLPALPVLLLAGLSWAWELHRFGWT